LEKKIDLAEQTRLKEEAEEEQRVLAAEEAAEREQNAAVRDALKFSELSSADKKTRNWFLKEATNYTDLSPDVVANWSEKKLNEELHKLSGWSYLTGDAWITYVYETIKGVPWLHHCNHHKFRFLEVAVGVGAFARIILQQYPKSSGVGFDIVPETLAIAKAILPADRFPVALGDMKFVDDLFIDDNSTKKDKTSLWPSEKFDLIIIPGALCYLTTMEQVQLTIKSLLARLNPKHGVLCASMIPDGRHHGLSCNIAIPKLFWTDHFEYLTGVTMLENMIIWKLPKSSNRYSVCIRMVDLSDFSIDPFLANNKGPCT